MRMGYTDVVKGNTSLVASLGEAIAHHVWALGLYLEESDLEALAADALTDGPNDKKIDFLHLDPDSRRIVLAQGYYGQSAKDSAPANKASDLNTAGAWLLSGDLADVPGGLRPSIVACREAISDGDVDAIELLYVHNLPESVNVARELQTAASHLKNMLPVESAITVRSRELGSSTISQLFLAQESHIEVKDTIDCPAKIHFREEGAEWEAAVLTVPGVWLHELFARYGAALFSANYRGFLGISRRRRINTGIRQSAEAKPRDFWVFNNGITVLTRGIRSDRDTTTLEGISVINGAQTTGSIGSVELARHGLADVRVMCRVIKCTDPGTISEIVQYNNTQNEITTWDQYANDPEQSRIAEEFHILGRSYAKKRGFRAKDDALGIEEVAQPLVAFHGRWQDASRGKNRLFERRPLYDLAFHGKKARHILLVFTLSRAVDERRIELKRRSNEGKLIQLEEGQLDLYRNLKFKPFILAVIPRVLEVVLGDKVDPETVAFSPGAAAATEHTLIELIASWGALVQEVVSFVAATVPARDFGEKLGEDDFLQEVVTKVSALMYAGGAAAKHKSFAEMLVKS